MSVSEHPPSSKSIEALGWNAALHASLEALPRFTSGPPLLPGRVSEVHRDSLRVLSADGELVAHVAGRLRHHAASPLDLPTVGDWVALAPRPAEGSATIHAVLPRQSVLARKAAGTRTEAQALTANVDTVFVVTSANQDLEPRRIERALVLVRDAGAEPVVLVNKTDLVDEPEDVVFDLAASLPDVPVLGISASTGSGLERLVPHLAPRTTVVLLGSSGVGKSTLTNRLLGEERMLVRSIREDDARGRHTTTGRHLMLLPCGAVLIDTPGIREVGLWGDSDALSGAFEDIEALAEQCRFADCSHRHEPGCAVQSAIDAGELDADRFESREKLAREMARLARKQAQQSNWQERRRFRALGKMYKEAQEKRRRLRYE